MSCSSAAHIRIRGHKIKHPAFTESPRVARTVDPQHLQPTTKDVPQSRVGGRVMASPCPQSYICWKGSPVGMWSCESLLGKMELGPPQARPGQELCRRQPAPHLEGSRQREGAEPAAKRGEQGEAEQGVGWV